MVNQSSRPLLSLSRVSNNNLSSQHLTCSRQRESTILKVQEGSGDTFCTLKLSTRLTSCEYFLPSPRLQETDVNCGTIFSTEQRLCLTVSCCRQVFTSTLAAFCFHLKLQDELVMLLCSSFTCETTNNNKLWL